MDRRNLATGIILVLFIAGSGFALFVQREEAAAPAPSLNVPNAEVTTADRVVQALWDEDAAELTGESGWEPVSLRHFTRMYNTITLIEIRNAESEFRATPDLVLMIALDDASLHSITIEPSTHWVEPGGSAFYNFGARPNEQTDSPRWNELTLIASATERDVDEGSVLQQTSIEGDEMHNHSDIDAPQIEMVTGVRDAQGIYSGSCFGPTSNDLLPAGSSVTFNQWEHPEDLPECGFAEFGMEASENLGIGGPYTREEHLSRFDQSDP